MATTDSGPKRQRTEPPGATPLTTVLDSDDRRPARVEANLITQPSGTGHSPKRENIVGGEWNPSPRGLSVADTCSLDIVHFPSGTVVWIIASVSSL